MIEKMQNAGANVELRDHLHTEQEGLEVLAGAECAIIPYPNHYGMSRVLVEASLVGTPSIVHDYGLIGHLVRRNGIGITVDCRNARSFREALVNFIGNNSHRNKYEHNLKIFSSRYSFSTFEEALTLPFMKAR